MFIVSSQRVPWWRAFFKSNTKVILNNRKTENYLHNYIKSLDKVELVPQKKSVELCGATIFDNMSNYEI